ncbi:hypothetical protein O8C76_10320 [Aliarcobacter butzleri]|uniref:Uncharacterized protein n=1 Tax=Aliarcobacter butzleri TaxID=28197 RepID=A0AAW7Q156_9BACT|nr:hypothetical protein [Aliarcobacter butzleri]MDN5071414.1 hypothetical protein [Aliarcobacter butzleri]
MKRNKSKYSILGITKETWSKWKKEEIPIVVLIEDYLRFDDILEFRNLLEKELSKEELEKFLKTGELPYFNKVDELEKRIEDGERILI